MSGRMLGKIIQLREHNSWSEDTHKIRGRSRLRSGNMSPGGNVHEEYSIDLTTDLLKHTI